MSTQKVKNLGPEGFEAQFRCCICLDIYIDPVSIPCAHNFCLDCIEGFWDTKSKPDCPLCKQTFQTRPKLKVNREFSSMIEFFKKSHLPTRTQEQDVGQARITNRPPAVGDVLCDVCNGSPAVRSCTACLASYCSLHLTPHLTDPALQRHRLTDPTPSASGLCRNHNKPLTMFCRQDDTAVCAKCVEREHKHHKVVSLEKQSRRIKTKLRETKADIAQMVKTRQGKIAEIKKTLDVGKKATEREISRSRQVCSMLKGAIDRQQTVLVQELLERQRGAEKRAEELLEELQGEIDQLQARSSELQRLELTKGPLYILQNFQSLRGLPPTRQRSEVAVYSDSCVGTVRRGFTKLSNIIQELTNQLSAGEAETMCQHEVSITFDSETASGWLVVSPDGKTVSYQKKKVLRPDNPRRFDSCVCVLGKQSFKSGRCCWVVQVGDKTDWDLGVARRSINRKGTIKVRPDNGYWAICRRNGGSLSACADPFVSLHLHDVPRKVCVFLDYGEGLVSFFNAEARTHIYTFSGCTFTEPLHPYFNPCVENNGRNVAPLVICPLEASVINEQYTII
ncbi:E3 ubiquitin-protein ligase TRIM39-like [Salarias fasciatus]|uniref:E3 ubiquitin-protein ligase TRIM39-like n=1 Tax=Salarias fasciatus TaxID=181472 RepID=UPI0011765A95|nr:E3 ubiquitin-protein ligase TRIM39-like [Salarias fasciatus]